MWVLEAVKEALGRAVFVGGIDLHHGGWAAEVFRGTHEVGDLGGEIDIATHDERHRIHMSPTLSRCVRVVVGLFEGAQLQRVAQLLFLRGFVGSVSGLAQRQRGCFDVRVLDGPEKKGGSRQ